MGLSRPPPSMADWITKEMEESMQKVIKRDGTEVPFDEEKIIHAIESANSEVNVSEQLSRNQIVNIVLDVIDKCSKAKHEISVEDVQELVETALMDRKAFNVAKRYIRYRYEHNLRRARNTTDDAIMTLVEYKNEDVKQENSNKNPEILSTQRDYIAGEVSKDLTMRRLLPKDIADAHAQGIIHFHDADYFIQRASNCCLVNLNDMLQNGTVISGTMIEKPHTFSTACNIATQIIAQVASSQYGGQSISLSQLAPFVDESRKYYRNKYAEEADNIAEYGAADEFIEKLVREDVRRGVQMIQYQVITLMTTNGQAPFVTVYMDINEASEGQTRDDLALIIQEVLEQRIQGVKNEVGVWITPAFPKLIYALDENNIYENSKYYYLTELAAKCTAKRMVPDYISAKKMRELKENNVFPCMGCRSFLTPYTNPNTGKPKFYGRFNQGVVTINLVDVACSSYQDIEEFWRILDERLELCHRALRLRHERLLGTPSDVAPILWQHGALARLKKGETIDKLLYDGYSTLSLGYAGLYECTYYMTGSSHTGDGKEFALEVMKKLNEATQAWREAENIAYSLYGTPLESTTYKFAKCLKKRFGEITGVTDRNYITNSYHIHVTEEIDAFSKLSFESEFQELSPGGAISYVEVPNMQNNIPAVMALLKHIYDNIMYAELNTKSDYCQVCGFDGEIQIVEDDTGKLVWECPNCGNRDQNKLNVARRTCGLTMQSA